MPMIRSGILLIDKPEGPSSAQVVSRVKRILGAKKVGHLGTLDPFASGLLLVGVNEGTKIADIFLSGSKTYCGTIRLGVETDTQDSTGKVMDSRPVPPLGEIELRALEEKFSGELLQIPPMFSALKKDGVRLYQLARQGKEVPREPRIIRIEQLQLRGRTNTEIEISVTCSRGTYIRTLAADIGARIGCGAHLQSLRRTACGNLAIDRAWTPDALEKQCDNVSVPLMPLAEALVHLRAVQWPSRLLSRLRLGQQEILSQIDPAQPGERLVRVLGPGGDLAALVEWTEDLSGCRWRLQRVFQE
jgi:tRNA pseudouridine55 synthase